MIRRLHDAGGARSARPTLHRPPAPKIFARFPDLDYNGSCELLHNILRSTRERQRANAPAAGSLPRVPGPIGLCDLRQQGVQMVLAGTLERLSRHALCEIRRAAVLALGFVADYEANHALGRALLDDDRTVRTLAENSIRCVWTRAGSEADRGELNAIMRLNAGAAVRQGASRASKLLSRSPTLAEAWNQRAYAHHALGNFAESIRDCHEALEINPYHFIAAMGMGRAYLELGNAVSALECFRRALRLNPDLEGVRARSCVWREGRGPVRRASKGNFRPRISHRGRVSCAAASPCASRTTSRSGRGRDNRAKWTKCRDRGGQQSAISSQRSAIGRLTADR